MPPGAVYIGRPSIWGNPFQLVPGTKLDTREKVVRHFRRWLDGEPDTFEARLEYARNLILDNLAKLHGKDLACWCGVGKECHGDVLLTLANPEFYCPEHEYNPEPNSGFALCPHCELESTETEKEQPEDE